MKYINKKKWDNNLIQLESEDENIHWYTTANRAGQAIGRQVYNIEKSINDGTGILGKDGFLYYATLVDGSEVKYKDIN